MDKFTQIRDKLCSHKFLYNKKGDLNSNLRKSLSLGEVDEILSIFNGLKFSPAIYCLIHDLREPPRCIECSNTVKTFYNFTAGFCKFCSLKCSRKNNISKEKRISTNLEKYGVPNPKQNKDVLARTEENNIKRYGVPYTSQLSTVRSKISSSVKAGYDSNHANIIKKKESTFLLRYGAHPNTTDSVKSKKIVDTLTKYGVEHTAQLESTKIKSKNTIIEKYGVDHYSRSAEYKELAKVRNQKITEESNDNFMRSITGADTSSLTKAQITELSNLSYSGTCAKLRELNIPSKDSMQDKVSSIEHEIANFIESLGISDIVLNDRTLLSGKELDILLPSHKLAIEIDGVYWHSEKFNKDKNYHLSKTIKCNEQGLQLLHIFDIEWTHPGKQEIWKSMIKSRLGLTDRIYGRKCVMQEVNIDDARKFCNENHLQGYRGGDIRLGLYHNNILVQLIILGKSRYNKQYMYELIRAATLKNHTVVGGLSKLLSNITDSLISYADRRYSNGQGYRIVGMVELLPSPPNYFYVVKGMLESRLKYQKHKLPKLLEIFDNAKSESYNMNSNGFYRIWDCGNLVFIKDSASKEHF